VLESVHLGVGTTLVAAFSVPRSHAIGIEKITTAFFEASCARVRAAGSITHNQQESMTIMNVSWDSLRGFQGAGRSHSCCSCKRILAKLEHAVMKLVDDVLIFLALLKMIWSASGLDAAFLHYDTGRVSRVELCVAVMQITGGYRSKPLLMRQ